MSLLRKFIFSGILFLISFAGFSQALNNPGQFRLPAGCTNGDFIQKTIIFRISDELLSGWNYSKSGATALDKVLASLQAEKVFKKFPAHKAPVQKRNESGNALIDLSNIYECTYAAEIPVEKAISTLLQTGLLEYVQPHYINKPLAYVPSDPLNFNQYHLPLCKFYDAWDIEKGDSNIVIGITDWGLNLNHPDLKGNIKYNYNDPIDGIDNDNDGYTDNYYGWDMGCNDNNPSQTGGMVHGSYSSGYCSATTDNGIGVSGTGFRCKFLPVKVSDASNNGTMTYESIVYAADHGCKVINCSWGGPFYQGPFGQQIIDYAVINCDAVVVVACGNDNTNTPYYPASYDHVLSVAATNSTDLKWSGSTYGTHIDICAPGESVWTTSSTAYDYSSGTSFASPIVAGAAALLRAHFPAFSALQVGEQLKVTADVIDTIQGNLAYAGLLGGGRLNMYNAIINTSLPSVRMENTFFDDADHNQIFTGNETVIFKGDFINYLAASSPALTVTLSTNSPYIQLINTVFTAGSIPTLGSVNNNSAPFVFYIMPTVPSSEEIVFKLTYADGAYHAIQYISLMVNKDYITIDTNKVATTITSNGFLGYNNMVTTQGVGFTYNNTGKSLMYNGGFIAGVSSTQVSDVLLGLNGYLDHDFQSILNVQRVSNPQEADFETYGIFNDNAAGALKMNIHVKHRALAWNELGKDRFIILEFTIANHGSGALNSFFAGMYVDWDLYNSLENRAAYLSQQRTGYVYSNNGGLYTGIELLSPGGVFHYAFDNNGNNGSINIFDNFTGYEKYAALHTNRHDAGTSGSGNDVSEMVSTGPFTIAMGDSIRVAFALLAGDYVADLQAVADAAQFQYAQLMSVEQNNSQGEDIIVHTAPNPFTDQFILALFTPTENDFEITICDVNGRKLVSMGSKNYHYGWNEIPLPILALKAGVYYCRINSNYGTRVKKIIKL